MLYKKSAPSAPWRVLSLFVLSISTFALAGGSVFADQATNISSFSGHSPFHISRHSTTGPVGLAPSVIKSVYGLTNAGNGSGTIAIIDAYDSPNVAADLNTFSAKYNLPQCNTANPCFEKHEMATRVASDSGWELEASLDTQWAHAIAPGAKILLVEAKSSSDTDLLSAINYARTRSDVVAVSMSWGGSEFSTETAYDSDFVSPYGAPFFASAGDDGTGAQWPAASPNVIGVGGTTLNMNGSTLVSETAWSGSGGGLSKYEKQPAYQTTYGLTYKTRSVPDVSYDANPSSGVAVYDSYAYSGQRGWFQVGGTSAGAPQWAAIQALGNSVTSNKLYADAKLSTSSTLLRDITSGTNGRCGAICTSGVGYDTVTGLGSPLTATF